MSGIFRDVLVLQNEIAGAIAGEIQGKLTPRQQSQVASSRPVNPEAQLAYWKARYLLNTGLDPKYGGMPEASRRSIESAQQAVRIDPGYAPAYAALAKSYVMLSDIGEAFPREVMPSARAAAEREG